jgi:hypothetical protein
MKYAGWLVVATLVGVGVLIYPTIIFIFSNSDTEKNTWPQLKADGLIAKLERKIERLKRHDS